MADPHYAERQATPHRGGAVARVGSMCTGIGGIELALVAAGLAVQPAWFAEMDPAASRVLAGRWPDVPNLGDLTEVDWRRVAAEAPVDLVTAGFPCQDVSAAGKRKGLRPGTRSGVWINIAYALGVLRPTHVLIENVKGLLSARAHSELEPCPWCVGDPPDERALRALGAVLGDLADLGYDATWHSLPAAAVGAPHLRWRVFILATLTDAEGVRLGHPGPTGGQGLPAAAVGGAVRPDGLTLLPTPNATDGQGGPREVPERRTSNGTDHGPRLRDVAVAALLPTPLRTEVTLLPTQRGTDGEKGGPNQRGSSGDLMLPSAVMELLPTPLASHGRNATATRSTEPASVHSNRDGWTLHDVAYADRWGRYAAAVRRWERAIGRPAPTPTTPNRNGNPRLAPAFVEWMMGYPEGWVTEYMVTDADPRPGALTRTDALRCFGNSVCPQQLAAALPTLFALHYGSPS
jgi:DNA (cytosine-5)-methyltransferase 1